jgi:hypothetical protein
MHALDEATAVHPEFRITIAIGDKDFQLHGSVDMLVAEEA